MPSTSGDEPPTDTRDLTIEDLRSLLSEARIRLDQYIGMCACPGMPCVTACRECDATQALVNRIRAFMQGRSAQ